MSAPRLRDGVRGIVLDPEGAILLVRFAFPDRAFWATPGGGTNPGESDEAALRRELLEETGLANPRIGPLVWRREHRWDGGARWDGQRERYYLVPTPRFRPAPRFTVEELAAEFVVDIRWWTPDELRASEEAFAPTRLPELVGRLLRDGPPPSPLDVGV